MQRPYIEKVGDNIGAGHSSGIFAGQVSLTGHYELFEEWRTEYQGLYKTKPGADAYIPLGRKILGWLKEKGLWAFLENAVQQEGFLEIRVPHFEPLGNGAVMSEADKRDRLFLDLPWEILAEQGYLAARAGTPFCPIRRIGKPDKGTPKPVPYRLSVAFMAASPRDTTPELQFELEEAAILQATKPLSLDLSVEESGNLELLAERIADLGLNLPDGYSGIDALHISCHGKSPKNKEPVLLLEDEHGNEALTNSTQLLQGFNGYKPGLLFLSACQTAMATGQMAVADSLAISCITSGIPAVLGWGQSVSDSQAIRFAAGVYSILSQGRGIETAVAQARQQLLQPTAGGVSPASHWHLARLYLGPRGGGVLANGRRSRLVGGRDHGVKEFLDPDRQQVPVASRYAFVGRRRYLQDILRELRDPKNAGVLIHGTGRQGKSSLAARVSTRMHRHTTVVVYGPKELGGDQSTHYTAPMILEAIAKKDIPGVEAVASEFRGQIGENPGLLRPALKQILDICEKQEKPLLLVVDDFEQALNAPDVGASAIHSAKDHCAPAVAALIEAFDDHRENGFSRLLFTSRYKFTLPHGGKDIADKLLALNLMPMSEKESRKQALAKATSGEDMPKDSLQERIITSVKGNPGLQERLYRLGAKDEAICTAAIDALQAYLDTGQDPEQEDVRAHLDDIFAGVTFERLAENERELLRASTMFTLPIGATVFKELALKLLLVKDANEAKKVFKRLVAFGLWDTMPDLFADDSPSYVIAPLAAPRAVRGNPLTEAEQRSLAGTILPFLLPHWGGRDGSKRPLAFDEELFRLGLLAEHAEAVNASGAGALRSLGSRLHYELGATIALQAVDTVRKASLEPAPRLLMNAAELCHQGGKTKEALKMAEQCVDAYEAMNSLDDEGRFELASARLRLAELLVQFGKPDEALEELQQAKDVFEQQNRMRDRSIALGYIARIYVQKGRVDEALKIHEEQISIYEDLGDRRSRAITLGDIARIYVSQGHVDEALASLEEVLQICAELGEIKGRAVTLGDIARIYVQKGRVDEALKIHEEQISIFEDLGDRRSRALTLGDIARIYFQKGRVDEALKIHEEQISIFEDLGDRRERAITLGGIARTYVDKGRVEDALKIHEERKAIYEDLGDLRERAVTLGDIARIYVQKGRVDEALKIHEERKAINENLGNADGIANASYDIAQIQFSRDMMEDALQNAEAAFRLLLSVGRVDGIAMVGKFFGSILLQSGNHDHALEVLEKSRQAFTILERNEDIAQIDAMIQYAQNGPVDPSAQLEEALEQARKDGDEEMVRKLSSVRELNRLDAELTALNVDPSESPEAQALIESSIQHLRIIGQDEQADAIERQLAIWRGLAEPDEDGDTQAQLEEALEQARKDGDEEMVRKLMAEGELLRIQTELQALPDNLAESPEALALLEAALPHLRLIGEDEQADVLEQQIAAWRG